jgi:crotonobetainyl-CoA:carnitine CoA-transferase CaiB-like acyl-CoA transferase
MNLARRADVDLLAPWMGHELRGAPWDAVAAHLGSVDAAQAVGRAQLLGIPAAVAVAPVGAHGAVRVTRYDGRPRRGAPTVLDCSALWAGPLCAQLLRARGATVRKVELVDRPDGARRGPTEFWERLNAGKEEVTADPSTLHRMLDGADAIVTAARPRAIEQLGLDLERRAREDGLLWVSVTGYGFASRWRDRVAFGDDAAVAGGLAVAAGGAHTPVFVGDAPADPLAGLQAASVASTLLEQGTGGFVDVSLRGTVAQALVGGRYRAAEQEVA